MANILSFTRRIEKPGYCYQEPIAWKSSVALTFEKYSEKCSHLIYSFNFENVEAQVLVGSLYSFYFCLGNIDYYR